LVGADVYYIRDCIPGEQESMLHELDGIYRIIVRLNLRRSPVILSKKMSGYSQGWNYAKSPKGSKSFNGITGFNDNRGDSLNGPRP